MAQEVRAQVGLGFGLGLGTKESHVVGRICGVPNPQGRLKLGHNLCPTPIRVRLGHNLSPTPIRVKLGHNLCPTPIRVKLGLGRTCPTLYPAALRASSSIHRARAWVRGRVRYS